MIVKAKGINKPKSPNPWAWIITYDNSGHRHFTYPEFRPYAHFLTMRRIQEIINHKHTKGQDGAFKTEEDTMRHALEITVEILKYVDKYNPTLTRRKAIEACEDVLMDLMCKETIREGQELLEKKLKEHHNESKKRRKRYRT